MDLSLDDFAAAVAARVTQWRSAGLRWQLHRGPTHDKSAAWIVCTTVSREAQLTVWTSGEAELDVVEAATGVVKSIHYEMSDLADLTACLDDLFSQLTTSTGVL